MTRWIELVARRRANRLRRGERGAVLVEVVIILPVLLVITMGVFDVGVGWKTSLTITSAVRSGSRVASNLGKDASADKSALSAMAASLGSIPTSQIERVVIFKATSGSATVPAACLTMTVGTGDAGNQCNVYSGAEMNAAATSTAFNGNCSTSRDRYWCPANRGNSQAATAGPDYVGVYLKVNHATKTKLFGSTMVIDDTSIMRIEPNAGNP